jgi:hypothetical protein
MKTIEQMYNEAKALVEDRTYQIGEISEKTGLQKTANGWRPPKKENKSKEKNIEKKAERKPVDNWEETRMASGKIYDTPDKSYRIIERKDIDTGESTFDIRNLKNNRAEDIKGIKSLEEAKAFVEKHYGKETNKENGVEKKTNKKPSIQEYMKAKDLMKKHEAQYKKEMDDYEYMERLKANGVNTSIFNPMFGGKPQPLENRSSYKEAMETVKSYETTDNACRITADTKIKLKNVVENKVKENA